MDRSFVIENNKSRERLRKMINQITDKELKLPLYIGGWTVSVALAHIAFWDIRRLNLIKCWEKEGISSLKIDTDAINDSLIPFFLAIPPRKAAEMSITAAEEVDRKIEKLSPDLISEILKLEDPHALNRAAHRNMHLDEIEKLLTSKKRC